MAILTVSREFGSGGREIAQAVAASLHYEYVDSDRVIQRIRGMGGKWEEWGKSLDERCPTVWEKYDRSFRAFVALIQSFVLEFAVQDRVVIMGRGGNFLLEGIPFAFRIHVVADLNTRVERIVRRDSMGRETAMWVTEKTDRDRDCFIYSIYGKHWDSMTEYDAVYDTGKESLESVIARVQEELAKRDASGTEESKNLLRLRCAAARVKAGLFTNPLFLLPTLDVESDGESIVLKGIVHTPKEHRLVEEEARKLAGDHPLKCSLHYRG